MVRITFSPRLSSSLFDIQLSIDRIKEYVSYRNEVRDPTAREIFWGRVEILRDHFERVLTTNYYENQSSDMILHVFLVIFHCLLREIPIVLDEIMTNAIDGLIRTNLRLVHQ